MEVIRIEDDDSIIEVRLIRSTLLQLSQIWKDNEEEENVIFVWRSQVDDLVKALKEGVDFT